MTNDEIVNRGLELRAALADPPGNLAARAYRDLIADSYFRKDLLPEVRFGLVDDGEGNQSRVDHLGQVLVLQLLRR